MPGMMPALGASLDLGLGEMLSQQVKDSMSEEERKRRMGISLGISPNLDFGKTGVGSINMGLGVGRR